MRLHEPNRKQKTPMVSKSRLADRLEEASQFLQQQPDILLAYLFGSHARQQAGPQSDVDIALLLDEQERSALDLLERRLDLAAKLDKILLVAVDVVLLNRASLLLQGQVLGEGQLRYAVDQPTRVGYEAYTRALYFDFQPRLRQHWEALTESVRK